MESVKVRNAAVSVSLDNLDLEFVVNGHCKTNQEMASIIRGMLAGIDKDFKEWLEYDDLENFFVSGDSSKTFHLNSSEFIAVSSVIN